jgi:hypothetical protein
LRNILSSHSVLPVGFKFDGHLGAQAGKARVRDVVTRGGFSRFHHATQTPFNMIFEARP